MFALSNLGAQIQMFLIDINWTWHIFGLLYSSHQSMHFHFTIYILKQLCSISTLLAVKNISAQAICHIFQLKMQLVHFEEGICWELTTNINICFSFFSTFRKLLSYRSFWFFLIHFFFTVYNKRNLILSPCMQRFKYCIVKSDASQLWCCSLPTHSQD